METPHPRLVPLLKKYEIEWGLFSKKGRPPTGVREKREQIVTELHAVGISWQEMMAITGLSQGAIQRLTKAMWNPASRKNAQAVGKKAGGAWKGKKRPGQLEKQWESGVFDFHRGRVRSSEERAILKASWTPERRKEAGGRSRKLWNDSEIRERILSFHRSPEERARRSKAQAMRMKNHPGIFLKGKAEWVTTPKGKDAKTYVRSSYEKAAVSVLEKDPEVVSYEHERRMECPGGRWILPDFIVTYRDGTVLLVEVKAEWVFALPESHKVRKRLRLSEDVADSQGWNFAIWSEKELRDALESAA